MFRNFAKKSELSSLSFSQRHIGIDIQHENEMLQSIGVNTLEELIDQTIPADIRLKGKLSIPSEQTEFEYLKELKKVALMNKVFRSYIGMGYYGTVTPGVILRNIFENPGWYTQYTPYQAEIAQGRLEALLNYQTMVSDLTGLPVANASLLDEGTAAAEAMHMFYGLKNKSAETANTFLVSTKCFPQTIDVLISRAEILGIQVIVTDNIEEVLNENVFGVLLQYPDVDGSLHDYTELIKSVHSHGAYVALATDLLALAVLKSPGEMDADVAVGNAQRFGVPMGFGGPHAAFFATKDDMKRLIPGRIIGVSIDSRGKQALRMALQTREQHIRREKATSNICTAQALLAIMSSMYAVYHGPKGIKSIAEKVHHHTAVLYTRLVSLGYQVVNNTFFDTLTVSVIDLTQLRNLAEKAGINFYYGNGIVRISLDETVLEEDVNDIVSLFVALSGKEVSVQPLNGTSYIPEGLVRLSQYLTHLVFNAHRSESQMLRYIKQLEGKDLSLTHSMIALGSCTMKLNATSELIPVSWPEFSSLHPFVPADQSEGYMKIINELENYLSVITGFAATSLQPNSGAQGEYAGLLVIRAYQKDIGQGNRDIALIPASAHGTNPASAVMAGLQVVVVASDENGNINVTDLREKAVQYKDRLSCLMVTYPSTHGIFEESIREICQIIHDCGGQVYMDGANMNAQVGLTNPAAIGADVNHINLHKTFAIPHGGGGPGMGPISVAAHLAPYLPGHTMRKTGGQKAIHAVSSAPFGSASILLISYGYIRMLGAEGITEATKYAILNANYIKAKLERSYKVLYTGAKGRVAHELILDLREYKQTANVEAEDVAKRLMDYGFHAPTLSFPVAGTIMIEPTESEDKGELDRFIDALLAIREEIRSIETGIADPFDNVLKNAPHTADMVINDTWEHPYSREQAVYPLPFVKARKFWPSIGRVNNSHGDRNLICTCPPIESYEIVS